LRDVWIRAQSGAVPNWRATDLATHASKCILVVCSVCHRIWQGSA